VLCERRWNYKNHDEPQQDTKKNYFNSFSITYIVYLGYNFSSIPNYFVGTLKTTALGTGYENLKLDTNMS
jgi:hypothetical protein